MKSLEPQTTAKPNVKAGVEKETAQEVLYRVPTSHAQRRFWVASQLYPGMPTFNVAVRWRLEGPIHRELMERACNLLTARHEVLRTTIDSDGDEVYQEIRPELACTLEFTDLSAMPVADRQAAAEEIAVREAQKPFVLSTPPLVRFGLLRLEENLHVLLCTAHHAVCDGLSVGVLADDLGQIYDGLSRGEEPVLAPLELQYADYAIWEQENPRTDLFQEQLQYWRSKLSGYKPFEVETDSPRPKVKTVSGHIVSRVLPRQLTDALAELSREQGCTLFTTCLTGLTALLQRLSNAGEVTLGTQVIGRERAEIESVVGVFTNTLALRIDASGDPTIAELLGRVRNVVAGALENQDIPFDNVVTDLGAANDPARQPFSQIHFIYQRSFVHNRKYEKFALVDMPSRTPGAGFDLNFFMVERPDGWRFSCEFNTDLFRQTTVEWMLQEVEHIFGRLAANMNTQLSQLPIEARPLLKKEATASPVLVLAPKQKDSSGFSEQAVAKLFQEVLGISSVGVDDSFFDLGGHSILAARLLAKIERKWSVRLSLADLVESPSPRTIVQAFSQNSLVVSDRVVPLQKGLRDPFFVISQSLVFHNVAKALGADRAVYALRMLAEDAGKLEKPYTMQAIAAYYVRLLREVQPTGPYRLAGWCVAAKIAYEVAQQLVALGETVETLVILDTWAPGHMRDMNPIKRALTNAAYNAHRVKLRLFSPDKAHQNTEEMEPTPVEKIEYAAADTYYPRPYKGRVVMCCSSEQPVGGIFDPTMGWGPYLDPMPPIHRIDGSHLGMFDAQGAAFIAAKILEASKEEAPSFHARAAKAPSSLLATSEDSAHVAV